MSGDEGIGLRRSRRPVAVAGPIFSYNYPEIHSSDDEIESPLIKRTKRTRDEIPSPAIPKVLINYDENYSIFFSYLFNL